jgi:hypothetical protein
MVKLCFSPAWRKHKPRNALLTGNLICGAAILTANHLDFFVKDYVAPALGAIDLYLHERYNLRSIEARAISDFGFWIEKTKTQT